MLDARLPRQRENAVVSRGLAAVMVSLAGWTPAPAQIQQQAAQQQAARPLADASGPATLPPTQGNLGHPYVLPPASRARMHACGLEWHKRKMAGTAGDEIWRVFASQCLVSPDNDALATEHALEAGRSKD